MKNVSSCQCGEKAYPQQICTANFWMGFGEHRYKYKQNFCTIMKEDVVADFGPEESPEGSL